MSSMSSTRTYQAVVKQGEVSFVATFLASSLAAAKEKAKAADWGGVEAWNDAFETNVIVAITEVSSSFSFAVLYEGELHSVAT